ncbi:hypothetical protein [Gemmatimonas phototrophica]|uniref:Lipoprotein n=1 Tax=Gemmatimonas phototrophica TaxID=1379270 RepID=A0A143BJJ9_9BACT|nr:hypothetical protein [Gemmatimonas phototrophica]AMW04773.1 hypothetical protein GEMMAAP_07880 [Gemmatimonas phototrophica]
MRPHHALSWLLVPIVVVAIAACTETKEAATEPSAVAEETFGHATHNIINEKNLSAQQRAYLGRLRNAVTTMQDANAMKEQGWNVVINCREKSGAGSQGVHYINFEMVKNGVIDELRPNILMYETQQNGRKRLIGVEWGVPLQGETPPDIHGLPFHKNTRDGLWVLHIWVPSNNPSGLFADWNPAVSCANDQPADVIN